MGLLSGVTDAVGLTDSGSGAEAAGEAGQASAAALFEARKQLKKGYKKGIGTLRPLTEMGTPEGFSSRIDELLQGGSLDPLIAENRRNLMGELSQQGLTRSGAGIQELSQLPVNTVMGIENQLYGRTASNLGNIANLQVGRGAGLADIYGRHGQDQASSILAGQQAEAADRAALSNLIATGAGAVASAA